MGTHRRISELAPSDIFPALADIAAPGICICCGAGSEEPVCGKCLSDLPYTRYWLYEANPMADAYNIKLNSWLSSYEPYAQACALFSYEPLSAGGELNRGYAAISRELKYYRVFSLGRQFGSMLGRKLLESDRFRDVDTVVPVPLHWTRRFSRGYNQAQIIAGAVADELGARLRTDLLVRERRTGSQTSRSSEQKAANVKGAFRARAGASPKHILLVDDVFTSGSTLSECHRALREEYPWPVKISAATLASVK